MNSPKYYLAALALACVLLALLLGIKTPNNEHFEGIVVSQTLTQSLDGHRLFLNIKTKQQLVLVQVDPKTDCPDGSEVYIVQKQSLFSDIVTYQLVQCNQAR